MVWLSRQPKTWIETRPYLLKSAQGVSYQWVLRSQAADVKGKEAFDLNKFGASECLH